MATYSIPYQNLTLSIPDDGQVFRSMGTQVGENNPIYKRVGNQIIQLGYSNGQTPGQQYESQYGAGSFANIAQFNMADAQTAFNQLGFKYVNTPDLSAFNPAGPVTGGPNYTQNISPTNPNGVLIQDSTGNTVMQSPSIGDVLKNVGATPDQIAKLTAAYATGPNATTPSGYTLNQHVLPQNIGDILGIPKPQVVTQSPIPSSGLSGNLSDYLTKILGAGSNTGTGTTMSSIGGLSALMGANSAANDRVQNIESQITSLMAQAEGQATDYASALDSTGVNANRQHLQEANLKAAQLKGELDTFDAETTAGLSNIEGQQIPLGLVQGQQAAFQKQRDLTRLAKAAELSSVVALAQAYQGNIQIGMDLAKQAVEMKYAPVLAKIDTLKTQLGFAQKELDKTDAVNLKIIDTLLDTSKAQVTNQANQEKALQTLAIQAASAGAPYALVTQMVASGDPVKAASIGAQYLKGAIEKVGSNAPSTSNVQAPTKSGTLVYTAQDYSSDSQALDQSRGSDGYVDPTIYQNLYKAWIAGGGRLEDFLSKFPPKNYVNPANTWLPAFLMPPKKAGADALFDGL